ncbi:MAG: hypothetical protein JWN86_2863 [Planctomycetota bacterium]|nr:hypothetical protein [Planctomycetota bacterium]
MEALAPDQSGRGTLMVRTAISILLSLVGAAVGAAVGVEVFVWLLSQSLYALVLPGACLGLGANLASRDRSKIRGVILGVVALALGIVTEWWNRPFIADASFPYFLAHMTELLPWTLIMIAVGTVLAFWWGSQISPWAAERPRGRSQAVKVQGTVEGDQN